jgi:hypothetical protein
MQTHPCGGFPMRAEGMLVKQEHQAGALPKLGGDRALHNELLALGNKACREIGAIRWGRSRHDLRPFEQIASYPYRGPYKLPQSLRQPTLEFIVGCPSEFCGSGGMRSLKFDRTTGEASPGVMRRWAVGPFGSWGCRG